MKESSDPLIYSLGFYGGCEMNSRNSTCRDVSLQECGGGRGFQRILAVVFGCRPAGEGACSSGKFLQIHIQWCILVISRVKYENFVLTGILLFLLCSFGDYRD